MSTEMQLGMLQPAERDRLAELEQVVDRGLGTFVEVGQALWRIRDERLYREDFGTFEAYCRERWNLSKPYATQLITAGATVAMATTDGLPAPASERVARELAPLRDDPEQLREAWSEVVTQNGDQPTAAQAREAVQKRRPAREAAPAPSPSPEPPSSGLPILAETVRQARERLERARQMVANMDASPEAQQMARAALAELDAVDVEKAALHADLRRVIER